MRQVAPGVPLRTRIPATSILSLTVTRSRSSAACPVATRRGAQVPMSEHTIGYGRPVNVESRPPGRSSTLLGEPLHDLHTVLRPLPILRPRQLFELGITLLYP